eukprot:SAG31_NODE_14475_length_804_cov_1.096454_1_plen_66_part_10
MTWAQTVGAIDGAVCWQPPAGKHARLPLQIISVWVRIPTVRGNTVPAEDSLLNVAAADRAVIRQSE